MLFIAPLLTGGAGATLRPMIDRQRGRNVVVPTILVTIVLGLVAGGIAGVLFVTAQLTAVPDLTKDATAYAGRSIPFSLGIGFIAGLTSEAVFGKLLGLDVINDTGVANLAKKA